MTIIEALEIIRDLARQNILREDMISDDETDPLWGELKRQTQASDAVDVLISALKVEPEQ